jgi:hypothetical protein
LRTSLCCLLLLASACGKAPGDGATAQLQVAGATYADGDLVSGDSGPAIVSTYARTSWVTPGQQGTLLSGTLGAGATAVLLGLVGDGGHWILPASAPDTQTPDQPTFSASLGFLASLTGPEARICLVAVDAGGRPGPASSANFGILPAAPPAGALVVELAWDTEADLDLHVVDPLGNELWAGDIASPQTDLSNGTTQGIFGFDSNANCVIDGRRAETVAWAAPPAGTYLVRVDAYSLCQASAAHWKTFVLRDGEIRMQAQGVATGADARFAKGRGGGVQALSFDWQ